MTIDLNDTLQWLRSAAPSTATLTTDTFNSPGTWTKPATVSWVEVTVVGGGGGGGGTYTGAPGTLRSFGGGGGGGRVIRTLVPVSAPVPVTVGSGGTVGAAPTYAGGAGGTSGFGPLGPGPIPTIPASTIAAGGGGGGGGARGPVLVGQDAPTIGGGGGGAGSDQWPPVPTLFSYYRGGRGYYGASGGPNGPLNLNAGSGGGAFLGVHPDNTYVAGKGLFGYGGGAVIPSAPTDARPTDGGAAANPQVPLNTGSQAGIAGTANTGGGGGGAVTFGSPTPANFDGGAGGSGVVIVRFFS